MGEVRNGTVTWVDLSTPDITGAQEFYAALLGWQLEIQRTTMGEYVVASVDGNDVAGMMAQAEEMAGVPPAWTVFIVVAEMEATLASVEAAGGTVVQTPFEIPGGSRVAVVSDTTGAMFALIGGGPEPGYPYFSDAPGGLCWVELMTSDHDASVEFYRAVFGWTAEADDAGPVNYTVFRLDDDPAAGMISRPESVPSEVPDSWSVYFTVSDCDSALEKAVGLGGSVLLPATPTPMGPFAVVADPAGAAFQIMEMAPLEPRAVTS